METIQNPPDAYFYYTLAVTSVVALIVVLKWVGGRLLTTLDKIVGDVNELKAGQQLSNQIMKDHHEDIKQIKQKVFFESYKSQGK